MSISSRNMLSESESKQILHGFGVEFAQEIEVSTPRDAVTAAVQIGFPVAIKLCSRSISHKTERGLVKLNIADELGAKEAADHLISQVTPEDGKTTLLVATMEKGSRELIVGLVNDSQFGKFVMCGLGGVFTETLGDSVFAPVPVDADQALQLIGRLKNQALLKEVRGEASVDLQSVAKIVVAISQVATSDPSVSSVDINPVIIRKDGSVVAVDALIERTDQSNNSRSFGATRDDLTSEYSWLTDAHFNSLFNPKGVVVVGASTHPGKFGFVSLHNILASGFAGEVMATNLDGSQVLGIDCFKSISDMPKSEEIDLAIVCTPAATNIEILQECAKRNIRAVYLTSAGYGESGEKGKIAEHELCQVAKQLGVMVVGPNGQGVTSTPSALCAQIVGPYPPSGVISVVSQSGNFVSSFMNYAQQTKVGISRAVSAGNAAMLGVPEFFDFFAKDEKTKVVLAYVEGVRDGERLANAMRGLSKSKPLVITKGGVSKDGARAAASHTGALASDSKIFDGVCASAGVIRIDDAERAFDVTATLATQPLPKGPNTIVLTTVGGWGVVTSDVISQENVLNLMTLPDDLKDYLSEILPNRWSHNNPIDCAGGETRETIADAMSRIAHHPKVDSVIFLGMGIQSNQARLMREGKFYERFELARIVSYHNSQDEKYATVAAELSIATGKPILVATELSLTDPTNPGVRRVQETGRLCYASGQRAARALSDVYKYAKWHGYAR